MTFFPSALAIVAVNGQGKSRPRKGRQQGVSQNYGAPEQPQYGEPVKSKLRISIFFSYL